MKLLINLCAHDGIVSHYAGVGTMVKRYIKALPPLLDKLGIQYKINLLTPEYNPHSFGFSESTKELHSHLPNCQIIQISNGSDGNLGYGTPVEWRTLSEKTAEFINESDKTSFDKILTIYNDTPFAGLLNFLNLENNHKTVWIPHSTGKIHKVDSSIENSQSYYEKRVFWELSAVENINQNKNCFLGAIGGYIANHLIKDYNLDKSKIIEVTNGELLDKVEEFKTGKKVQALFNEIQKTDEIILSYGRAEKYKNLEGAMRLGQELGIKAVVVVQSYFEDQPLLKYYKRVAQETGALLFIDPPFALPNYILDNYKGKIIVLIPSRAEIFGLIVNEIRKKNKNNILIVANNTGGLREQIDDGKNGVLVNLRNIKQSALKIKSFLNDEVMLRMNENSQRVLEQKYNLLKNMYNFIAKLLEV